MREAILKLMDICNEYGDLYIEIRPNNEITITKFKHDPKNGRVMKKQRIIDKAIIEKFIDCDLLINEVIKDVEDFKDCKDCKDA